MASRVSCVRALIPTIVIVPLAVGTMGCSSIAPSEETYAWMMSPPAKGDESSSSVDADSPYGDWSEITKDSEEIEGLFTLYKKREELYAKIETEDFEKDFLIALSIGQGVGSRFLLGGLPWGTALVRFERADDHVQLIETKTRFVGDGDESIQRAVELSYGESVLHAFKVESEQDSTAVLINLGAFLESDYADLGTFLGFVMDTGVQLDAERTRIESVKAFPQNAEFDVAYSFSPGGRYNGFSSVSDNRNVPLTLHWSISELPESDYVPRFADPRAGYFLTAHKDFSKPSEAGYFVRYTNRWKLKKADPSAAISDPVEPIVYYVDSTIPEAYRPWVHEGIEAWQEAFEAAGFSNAIIAKDAPVDDPDFDPEDVRYSSVRWITSHEQSFGAIGPSRVDPRTGQILDADVLIEDSFVQGIKNMYTRLVNARAVIQRLSTGMPFHQAMMDPELERILASGLLPDGSEHQMCTLGVGFAHAASMMGLSLLANGQIGPGDEVPMEFVGEGMKWVVMHEVGHTLGLRHNFKSSSDIPFDKLNDRDYVANHGMTASVMDYASPNVARDPADQGYYYGPRVGSYDRFVIRYGYTDFGASTPEEEVPMLRAIASESSKRGHSYGTDHDTYPSTAPDPRSAIFDLSDDPIAWAERQCDVTNRLLESPNLDNIVLSAGENYPKLRRAVSTILFMRANAVGIAAKFVGGTYVSRDHFGSDGANPPLAPVPAAEQRRALALVFENVFAPDAFDVPDEILSTLMPERWSHWGTSNWNTDFLFPLHDWASAMQSSAIASLFATANLRRMKEAETWWDDSLTMAELFDLVSSDVWSEVNRGRTVSSMRRNLQRVYLDRMVAMAVTPSPALPDDASALARHHLRQLQPKAASAARTTRDTYTKAHLEWVANRIERALEAEL